MEIELTTEGTAKVANNKVLNLGQNCGSEIFVNEYILVVSCPEFNSGSGMIEVYDQDNKHLIFSKYGEEANKHNLGTHAAIISNPGIDTVLYNSDKGLQALEIYWSLKDPFSYTLWEYDIASKEIMGDENFGKYFEVVDNQIFVTSESNEFFMGYLCTST